MKRPMHYRADSGAPAVYVALGCALTVAALGALVVLGYWIGVSAK